MGRSEETAGSRLPKWHDEGVFENVASNTPLKHRSLKPEGVALNLSELLLLEKKGSSRGRSAIQVLSIVNCRLPISVQLIE
jgi:hypothetical protein